MNDTVRAAGASPSGVGSVERTSTYASHRLDPIERPIVRTPPRRQREGRPVSVLAVIAVDAEDFALGQVLGNGGTGTRIELTQFVPVEGDLVPYFWVTRSADLEGFERHVRADSRVSRLTDLDSGVDRTLYRIEWAEEGLDGFLDALGAQPVLVERAAGTAEEWVFRLRAGDREALSKFQEACLAADVPLDVRRIVHDPEAGGPDRYGITDKQATALRLAFEEGYFQVPRGASQTDLADHLGISRQAYSRRLNRALDTLVESTFMTHADFSGEANAAVDTDDVDADTDSEIDTEASAPED
jgi:predicted DNA binding protein